MYKCNDCERTFSELDDQDSCPFCGSLDFDELNEDEYIEDFTDARY